MEALKRKVDLSVKRSMTLSDGTKIDLVGVTTRKFNEIVNNKRLNDFERGLHLTAAKIRVNDQEVVFDDLADCFLDDEMAEIVKFANPEDEKNG
jgi:hypothetical protein